MCTQVGHFWTRRSERGLRVQTRGDAVIIAVRGEQLVAVGEVSAEDKIQVAGVFGDRDVARDCAARVDLNER
eukprot:6115037-Prymnesium_polylepis.1